MSIEYIEGIDTELQVRFFANRKVFEKGKVFVVGRATSSVTERPGRITELQWPRQDKSRCIKVRRRYSSVTACRVERRATHVRTNGLA